MKCFEYYADCSQQCLKKECRYWMSSQKDGNCTVVAVSKGSKTLQDIGEIFNITRMRVCQIEKRAIQKLKNILDN